MRRPSEDQIAAWYPRLLRTALRLTGSEEDAADLTQQAFCQALGHWDRFDGRCMPTTWLHRILLNVVRDHVRRRAVRAAEPLDAWVLHAVDGAAAQNADRNERLARLRGMIQTLPEPIRLAFVATVLDGYSYRETAGLLNVPVGTVASRVSLARYGEVPRHTARLHVILDQRDRARAVLDKAAEDAIAAGAWAAMPKVRAEQVAMTFNRPPDDTMAMCRRFSDVLRSVSNYHTLAPQICRHLASTGDPQQAVAFLQTQAASHLVEDLIDYYSHQVAMAQRGTPAAEPPHRVLVRMMPRWGPLLSPRSGQGWRWKSHLPSLPTPGTIACEMRLSKISQEDHVWYGDVTVGLSGRRYAYLRMFRDGSLVTYGRQIGEPLQQSTPVMGNAFAWCPVEVSVGATRTTIRYDDHPFLWVYHDTPFRSTARGRATVYNASGELRNLRYYVASNVRTDNDTLETLFEGWEQALRGADLNEARRCQRDLLARLSRVPEAAAACDGLRRDLRLFEAVVSPEGLDLCRRVMLRHADQDGYDHGTWELNDGWLIARPHAACGKLELQVPMPLPDDLELTGVVDLTATGARSAALIGWHMAAATAHTMVRMFPGSGDTYLGSWYGRSAKASNIELRSSPLPFCIRTRGDQAVFFARFGSKPDLKLVGVQRTGHHLVIRAFRLSGNEHIRLTRLRVRHLPKDTPLDAPVRLPQVATTQPSGRPEF